MELPDIQEGDVIGLHGQRHLLRQRSPSFAPLRYSISGAISGCFLVVPSSEQSLSLRTRDPLPWQPAGARPHGISSLHCNGQGIMGIPPNSVQENAVCKCNREDGFRVDDSKLML